MSFSEHKLNYGDIVEFEDGFKVLIVDVKEVIDGVYYEAGVVNLTHFDISDYYQSMKDVIPNLEVISEPPIVNIYPARFS